MENVVIIKNYEGYIFVRHCYNQVEARAYAVEYCKKTDGYNDVTEKCFKNGRAVWNDDGWSCVVIL